MGIIIEGVPDYKIREVMRKLKAKRKAEEEAKAKEKVFNDDYKYDKDSNKTDRELANEFWQSKTTYQKYQLIKTLPEDLQASIRAEVAKEIRDGIETQQQKNRENELSHPKKELPVDNSKFSINDFKLNHPMDLISPVNYKEVLSDLLKVGSSLANIDPSTKFVAYRFAYGFDKFSSLLNDKPTYNSRKLMSNYFSKYTRNMDIKEFDNYDDFINLPNKIGELGKIKTSVSRDFIKQVQGGGDLKFINVYPFHNGEIHASSPFWSIGKATLSGRLVNIEVKYDGDKYVVTANIKYAFFDKYTEPAFIHGFEPGTPFNITGSWVDKNKVTFTVDEKVADRLAEEALREKQRQEVEKNEKEREGANKNHSTDKDKLLEPNKIEPPPIKPLSEFEITQKLFGNNLDKVLDEFHTKYVLTQRYPEDREELLESLIDKEDYGRIGLGEGDIDKDKDIYDPPIHEDLNKEY